jgi:ribose transport system ATP-binding protein
MTAPGVTPHDETLEPATGLVVRSVSKTFAGTRALKDVSAHFPRGKITALLGQNGSGKSTLIKILAGFYYPDEGGRVLVNGQELPLPVHPHQAHEAGLRFLHQDLGLVQELSVADNFAFVNGFGAGLLSRIRNRAHQRRVKSVLDRFSINVRPAAVVKSLTPTEQTMVAIARAMEAEIAMEDRIPADSPAVPVLVLDEPTASLPASEVDEVFRALRHARDTGATVIFVSHRLDEVIRLADHSVILRDGQVVADEPMSDLTEKDIVHRILGYEFQETHHHHPGRDAGDPVIEARSLSGTRLRDVDLTIHAGEIVGVTGLLGCGRSELARLLAGAQQPAGGELVLNGRPARFSSPQDAIAAGIAYVPQDRRHQGCIPALSVRHNITLSDVSSFFKSGLLRQGQERAATRAAIEQFDIRPAQTERPMAQLSGGNQQKAVIAKWTRLEPRLLVLDEPTQGVDIGAKHEIAAIIEALAGRGVAIVVASSDFDELVRLCDRVLVFNRGDLVADVPRPQLSEARLTLLSSATKEPVS